jgi:hypothetical protein
MTLHPIADLVRAVRTRSPRWLRNPRVVFRLRMRQRYARRNGPERWDD